MHECTIVKQGLLHNSPRLPLKFTPLHTAHMRSPGKACGCSLAEGAPSALP